MFNDAVLNRSFWISFLTVVSRRVNELWNINKLKQDISSFVTDQHQT